MAKLLKLRRGTTSQHGSFTGAEGEVTVDTDKETLVVHDGSTAGGHPVAAEDMANVSSASIAGRLDTDSIAPAKIAAGTLPTDVTVASANIVNGTILTEDLAANSINADKLADNAVTSAKLASNAVTTERINADAVTTAKILDGNITNAKIASNAAIAGSKISPSFTSDISTQASGVKTILVGSTNAAGAVLILDGDSNGDGSGSDYASITHNSSGNVEINNRKNASIIFKNTSSETQRMAINADGHVDIDGNLDVGAGVDVTGNITVTGTVDGRDVAADGTKLDGVAASANAYVHPNHSGEVTSSADGATTIASNIVDEDNLKISNSGSNGQYLQKQSGNTGGLTWATVDLTTLSASNLTSGTIPDARFPAALPAISGANLTGVQPFPSGTKMIFQQSAAPTGWTKITSSVDNKALRLVSGNVGSGGNTGFTTAFASYTPAGNVGASGNSTASWSGNATTGNSGASTSNTGPSNTGNAGASTSSVSTSGNVNNHTLSTNQMPSHSHTTGYGQRDDYGNQGDFRPQGRQGQNWYGGNVTNYSSANTGGGGSHSHGFSGSSHSHNVNNHTHSVSVSGNTGNHTHNAGSFSGSARDFAVTYIDVIVASKN